MTVLRRTFEACANSVADVRRAATEYAREQGAATLTVQNVALAVSEAASNVVVHAYRDGDRPGEIELEARVDGGEIVIAIRDQGIGMTPRPDSPGLGLGMPLIANLAERVEIASLSSGGTEVRMHFGLPSPVQP